MKLYLTGIMGLNNNADYYWYWLCNIPGIGRRKITSLLDGLGSAKAIYGADDRTLRSIYGIEDRECRLISDSRADKSIYNEFLELEKHGVRFVHRESDDYPERLRHIHDSPVGLYVRGKLVDDNRITVAIIGARGCTDYGRQVAYEFGKSFAYMGIQVVSGMALGIDGAGQRGCLDGGGFSVGVLGCGADICYPRENIDLYTRLVESGGIISEYPLGMNPLSGFFPERNRIISGLSDVVIVVEARQKSGSLITVDQALEQNKEIMAVPGRIGDPLSKGCNELIKMGAMVITCPEDIKQSSVVERWMESYVAGKKYFDDDKTQCNGDIDTKFSLDSAINSLASAKNMVYSQTNLYPKDLDTISKETGLDVTVVSQLLLDLQLQGVIREVSKNCYVRCGI